MYKFIVIVLISILFISCNKNKDEVTTEKETQKNKDSVLIIKEDFVSKWNENDNVDSPAFYQNGEDEWIIATMKESDGLIIYDANDGSTIKKIGKSGAGEVEFERPNGIWVINDLALIVERDNHRVQVLSLPDFKFLGFIGADKLIRPYGLCVFEYENGYELYVTDQYETEDEKIPADSELGERVHHYNFNITEGKLAYDFVRYLGEISGKGALRTVESIFADPNHNNLMIAEETEEYTHIKIYDLEKGTYKNSIGEDLFKYQAEGIALYDCGNNEGFWFLTDQHEGNNTFHIFDRKTLEYITSFKSKTTQNTDGVWLTQTSYGKFPAGAFIAVHNDGGIGLFDLRRLMKELDINCK